MGQVRVRFFGPVRTLAGRKEQLVEMAQGSTIRDLLNELKKTSNPEFQRYIVIQGNTVNPVLMVSLNGESLDEIQNIDALLPEAPVLDVMLVAPIVGGQFMASPNF